MDSAVADVVAAAPAAEPVAVGGAWPHWRYVRWAAGLTYFGIFCWFVQQKGLPWEREILALWIIGALATTCVGRWRMLPRIFLDWLPFIGIFAMYDYSRGIADGVGMPLQVHPQIWVDKVLFLGKVPSVWFQELLFRGSDNLQWYDAIVAVEYVSHFFAPLIVAGVYWVRSRPVWRQFVFRLMFLSFMGVATFILLPAAPPWWASQHGYIGELTHGVATKGWSLIHIGGFRLGFFEQVLNKGKMTLNPVAALPSLHAAYAMLIALFIIKRGRRKIRWVWLVHPFLMAFALVYGGEHYVADVLLGWLYVLVTFWACARLERWWAARQASKRAAGFTPADTEAIAAARP